MRRSCEVNSDLKWPLAAAIALLAYFVGTIVAPILYPYKMFISDSTSQIIVIQLQALVQTSTYLGRYAVHGYVGLTIIFLIIRRAFNTKNVYFQIFFFFLLGIYYGMMINGGMAGQLHAAFDDAVRPWLPALTRMPLYLLFPLLVMLGLPLIVAYGLSKIDGAQRGRREK